MTLQVPGATTRQQIRALVWKDGVSMRRHYVCLAAELLVPIAAAVVTWLLLAVFAALPGLSLLRGAQQDAIWYTDNAYVCSEFTAAAPPVFASQLQNVTTQPAFPCGGDTNWDDAPNAYLPEQIGEAWKDTEYSGSYGVAVAKSLWPDSPEPSPQYTLMYSLSNFLTWATEGTTRTVMFIGAGFNGDYLSRTEIYGGIIDRQRYKRNEYQMFATFGAWVMAFAHIPLSSSLAGRLVDEKRNRVREHLKVLGVRPAAYLASVMATASLRILFNALATLTTVGLTLHDKMPTGDVCFVGVAMLLFGFSLCAFGTVLPAFISRSQIAIGVIAVYICAFAIGAAFLTDLPAVAVVPGAVFFAPVAMTLAVAPVLGGRYVSLPISPGACLACLVLQALVCCLLGEYLYAINPGTYGVPKHPLFPCRWLARVIRKWRRGGDAVSDEDFLSAAPQQARATNDDDPRARVIIEGLVKYFGSQRDVAAVDGLSLTITQGEIFALLGHNGAGKTTTISILIGMLAATDYRRCTVAGHDVRTDMDGVRRAIGCCPQFDILFEDLSGLQHMQLYAAVKGVRATRAEELLTRLTLPLTNAPASTYSGGMKRRLSVGTALVGGCEVVFLDEPSSGLDPVSRRKLWQLLKDERASGRTIVLTTHFMEEADYLGDRIAIMAHGRVVCQGTTAQLKQQHGVGYYLTLTRQQQQGDDSKDAVRPLDVAGVLELCNEFCDGEARLHHETHCDAVFLLPARCLDRYGDLLGRLESSLTALGADSYGLAPNSLEDVFVSVTHAEERAWRARRDQPAMVGDQPATDAYRAAGASDADADHAAVDTGATDADAADTMSEEELAAMFAASAESWTVTLFLPQTYAIFVKKLLVLRRSARLLFMSGVLPLVFIIVGFLTAIPNFLENVDSETWPPPVVPGAPDMSLPLPIALHPTPVIPQDNNNWYQYVGPMHAEVDRACFDAIVSAFEGAHADYRATTDPTLPPLKTAVLTDPVQIQTGAFLDTRSISPVAKLSQPPPVLFINGCPANSLSDVRDFGAPFVANFTWMYQYPGQLQGPLLLYDMLLRTALTQLGTPPGQPKMAVPRAVYEPLPLIKSTWYVPQPVPPKSYIETVLAVITVVAVTLYSGSQALLVAEEMNKGTFELLRMQGLHAVSYWVGTYAFDLLAAAPMVGLFIAGAWIRDIEAMKQGCMVSLGAASLVALISFALLFAYALVSLLPRGLSQGAYVAAVLTSNVLLLALPFLIVAFYWADAKRQGVSADEDSYKWTWYITPQRAFMILLSMQADLPYTQCVWTRGPTPRWGLVCIAAWHAVPVVVLWLTTHRDRFSRPPRLDDTEGEATGAAGSNGSEATHLLPRTTVAAGEGDATEEEDVLADPDVRREHHRVGRRALAHDPSQPTDLRKFGERMRGGATTVQSPASADSAALDADRDGDMLLVRSLRKLYRTTSWLPWRPAKEKLAVRGVSLGLRAGECFGLLGPNGAGKTTTVKMMLREHNATTGAIDALYVPPGSNPDGGDSCCAPSRGTVYRGARYGVCPQFDALWDQLTAEEHMAAYLRIRLGFGYRGGSEKFKRYVKASLAKVQLDGDHLGKPSEAYSGGMKRKLSVCIALFTGAAAVFLDEPSTGMDPHARRALWQSIHEALLRGDRCVLLTTHSMEEADAVCGRIAIVTDGVMRCIGSSHHLKQRFGSGYSVTLTLNATAAGGAGGSNRSFGDAAAGVVSGRSEQLHTPRTESERLLTTNAARNSSFGGGRKGRRDAVDPVVAAEIDAAMKAEFGPTCELAEALGLQRRYAVAELASPAAAFATLAARRAAWGLESYSLAHLASLEQIFLHFAGAGDEDDSEDATGTDARAEVLP